MYRQTTQEEQGSSKVQDEFLALLQPILPKLSRYALAMTHDREEAKDLVSESIALAFENFHAVRVPEAFTGYLFTVTKRFYLRRKQRRSIWVIWSKEHEERSYDPESALDAKLDCEALDNALARLPIKQREAVVLFEISELSLEEIRQIQGGSISGVKSRISRGRKHLAKILGATPIEKHQQEILPDAPTFKKEPSQFAFLLTEKL